MLNPLFAISVQHIYPIKPLDCLSLLKLNNRKTVGWSEWLQSSYAASLYILIAFQHGFETLASKIQHVREYC